MKKGFTLVEMLVVIGIIAVLMGASMIGFSKMLKSADKAKAQELVSNTATALTALFDAEGVWPKRLRDAANGQGRLDEDVVYPLAKSKKMSISYDTKTLKATGLDRFGLVTPWAAAVIKRKGNSASKSSPVTAGTKVEDHILYFALDLNGDGVIKGNEAANIGGESVEIRATAAVWCIGKDNKNQGKPYPYKTGLKKGDVYSWSVGQTREVK